MNNDLLPNRHHWDCKDCITAGTYNTATNATYGAEWHNTNTGHNVTVTIDRETWELTENGWEKADVG